MNELQETIETLIDLDEPEALLATLRRIAAGKRGERWQKLAAAIDGLNASLERAAHEAIRARQEAPADSEAKAE